MARPTTKPHPTRLGATTRLAAGLAVILVCCGAIEGCGDGETSDPGTGGSGASGSGVGGDGAGGDGAGGALPSAGDPCEPLSMAPCAPGDKCGGWFESGASTNLSFRCVPDGSVAPGGDCQSVSLADGMTDDCSDGAVCLSTPGGGSSCFALCDPSNPQCGTDQPECQAPYDGVAAGVCVFCSGEYVTDEKTAENRLYYDYSHNQEGAPQQPGSPAPQEAMEIFVQQAASQGLTVANLDDGIRKVCLSDCDILFISTPKTAFSAEEKNAVIDYVNEGGRLLFSMDDDVHSDLAQSEANDILAPFGLSFGGLVAQTSGAFTYAGTAVTPTQRNITYLSGRTAAGGTPFMEINNTATLIGGVFAEPMGGGRIVVLAENTPFIDAFINSQDNVAFVNDVLQWLAP